MEHPNVRPIELDRSPVAYGRRWQFEGSLDDPFEEGFELFDCWTLEEQLIWILFDLSAKAMIPKQVSERILS